MTTGNRLGTLVLTLKADGKQLATDLSNAESSTAQRAKAIGGTLTKTLTPAVTAVGGAVFAATEELDRAFKVIETGTGASGAQLEGLKASFQEVFGTVDADAGTIAANIADLNTRLGLTGPALEAAAANASQLGIDVNQVAQAMNIFGVENDTAAGFMDKLFVIAQDTGIPLDNLTKQMQTYGPVLANAGFTADETAVFFGNLNAAGVDASRVMPGLNAFMRNLAKEGITDTKGALDEVILSMTTATTDTEALNIATQAFGAEGAQRLLVAARDGAFEVGELTTKIQDADGAILANAESTRTNTESLKLMRQEISEKLAGAWASLPEPIQATGLGLGGVLTTSGPLLMALPGIATAIGGVGAASGAISAGASRAGGMLGRGVGALSGLASLGPLIVIVAVLAGLIALGILVWKNWDTVKQKTVQIWGDIKGFFIQTWFAIKNTFANNWQEILAIIFPAVGLPLLVKKHWGAISGVVGDIWDEAAENVKAAVNRMIGLINAIIRAWNSFELKLPSKTFNLPFGQSVTFGGASIGTPNIPLIPRLAEGGIVTGPTLALIGERGPEAVVPLGGHDGFGPGQRFKGTLRITDGWTDLVGEAMIELEERGG